MKFIPYLGGETPFSILNPSDDDISGFEDGKVPVKVILAPTNQTTDQKSGFGILTMESDTSLNKGGVRRLVLRTKLPVPVLVDKAACSCGDSEQQTMAEITVHSVITLPKTVADSLLGTDTTRVALANAAANTAVAVHMQHLAKAVGLGGAILTGTTVTVGDPTSADAPTIPVFSPSIGTASVSDQVLADAEIHFHEAREFGNLRRYFAGTGASLADLTVTAQ